MKVGELMTTDVVTVGETVPIKDAAVLLAQRRISGLPVVDRDGSVVGVLSEADVLVQQRGATRSQVGLLRHVFDPDSIWREKAGARTVADAMTTPAICIGPHRPVNEAAARMLDEGVNRLPVVEHGRLVGIVTRADLVQAFVRADEDVEREIRDDVFGRALWLDPEQLTVTVGAGVATVFGALDSPADDRVMQTLVSRVPGVVSVVSRVETQPAGATHGAR
jgi:CBS domain-containing protein